MSEKYERICRIASIIEARADLMSALSSCFNHFYRHGDLFKEIKTVRGGSRVVYTNLGQLVDPVNDERLYLGLKLGRKAILEYQLYIRHQNKGPVIALALCREIANLENLCFKEAPNLFGAVIHHELGVAGLLVEDFSAGGVNRIVPRKDIGDCEGDYLDVISPDGKVRTVFSDAKRYEIGALEDGKKYFIREAAINL